MTVLAMRVPVRRPVRLQIVMKMRGLHGVTSLDAKGFLIQIGAGNRWVMMDTLIHEWAHARAWGRGKAHGDRWGREYARAYRTVIGEDTL